MVEIRIIRVEEARCCSRARSNCDAGTGAAVPGGSDWHFGTGTQQPGNTVPNKKRSARSDGSSRQRGAR